MQELYLFFFFNSFADGIYAEGIGHPHEFRQEDPVVFAFIEPFHKTHVKLEEIEPDRLEHVKGRIAAPEIIHPDRKAEVAETVDLLPHKLKITADRALRDFYRDHVAAELRCVHAAPDLFHHITAVKIRP